MPTTTATSSWATFRGDVQTTAVRGYREHVKRLAWNREQIAAAQRDGVRRLLAYASERSPFHRARLAGIDLDRIEPTDLSRLPVMTKGEMMASLDDVFTDRRLNLDRVERALDATDTEPVPILDEYIALASGGSSGHRGVYVADRAAVVAFLSSLSRSLVARLEAMGGPPPGGLPIAMIAAGSAVHATGVAPALSAGGGLPFSFHSLPVTSPVPEIVERLNVMQPPALYGYASMLARLAAEQQAGHLSIAPLAVTSTSETLLPEVRATITEAFSAPVVNTFGSTEGLVGTTAPDDDVLVFNSDLCIVEVVDEDNQPVEPGTPSAKVLVTNLFNLAQPLIRFEINDVFIRQPDSPDHGHLRAHVEGRADDILRYGEVEIHPVVVRGEMVKTPEVIDYQAHQTAQGLDIDATAFSAVDTDDLAGRIRDAMAAAGLREPHVSVRIVDGLTRNPHTGKLRRFIPLAS